MYIYLCPKSNTALFPTQSTCSLAAPPGCAAGADREGWLPSNACIREDGGDGAGAGVRVAGGVGRNAGYIPGQAQGGAGDERVNARQSRCKRPGDDGVRAEGWEVRRRGGPQGE